MPHTYTIPVAQDWQQSPRGAAFTGAGLGIAPGGENATWAILGAGRVGFDGEGRP